MTRKERNDQWTPEDDITLAETVLNHIRAGSTPIRNICRGF